jgi:tRNA U55 pseudouridine synthase TruB
MKKYVVIDKKVGETPLMALGAWKKENPEYAEVPASYAGRLDPMASGKLLVLLGEECKRQGAYTKLDKEYEIEVLLDVGSDTGDILGLVECALKETKVDESVLKSALADERGSYSRAYPAFSSKTVNGKPLFTYALADTLSSIEIPRHDEHLYSVKLLGITKISSEELRTRISESLALVPRTNKPSKVLGRNFRIDDVCASWDSPFVADDERNFSVIRLCVTCAAGSYMRTLAPRIGASLGTKALALSITRTKIGRYIPLFRKWGIWVRAL